MWSQGKYLKALPLSIQLELHSYLDELTFCSLLWEEGQVHTQRHNFNYCINSLLEPFRQQTKPIVQCKVQIVKHELK